MDRDQILLLLRERIVAFAASRYRREFAEDVAQEVLELLVEKYPHVSELAELVPLALRIARFKILSGARTAVRRGEYSSPPLDVLQLESQEPDPAEMAERSERLERLRAALRELGERCRELFRLKLEGRSFPEIQKALRVDSINTIYTWDARCRKQLRERIAGGGDVQR